MLPPHRTHRVQDEKNWAPFVHEGRLHAVYSVAPVHNVLEIDLPPTRGGGCQVVGQFNLGDRLFERHGRARGGAPPILHNGEYYHFFHSRTPCCKWNMGVLTFQVEPPFQPLRYTPPPILWPDLVEKPDWHLVDCVFPCGAILRDGVWNVSFGAWDAQLRLTSWRTEDIEGALVPIPPDRVR